MVLMLLSLATARSPVFNAMFEHEMEESKKVSECYRHMICKGGFFLFFFTENCKLLV